MVPEASRQANDTMISKKLYLAIELSEKEWKLGFTVGPGQAPRVAQRKGRRSGWSVTGNPAGQGALSAGGPQ